MTVNLNKNKDIFAGDGFSTSYDFDFKIFATTDIIVQVLDNVGVYHTLSLGSDYTVSTVVFPNIGHIDLNPAGTYPVIPIGYQLVLLRILPITQNIDISDYSGTPAYTWNEAFDRACMISQQLNEEINRAFKSNVTATITNLTIPDLIPTYYLQAISTTELQWVDLTSIINTAVGNAQAAALAASTSESNASGFAAASSASASAASISAGAASADALSASNSAIAAAASAAKIPDVTVPDALKQVRVNALGTAYELFNPVAPSGATRVTFTNADLVGGVLTIPHNLGLAAPYLLLLQIYDDTGKQILNPDSVTGSTNSHAVDLTSLGVSGTWGYIYS